MDLPCKRVSRLLACWLLVMVSMVRAQSQRPLQSILENRVLKTSASCDNQYIYFRINFEQPFRGLIYTEDAFPSCIYVNGTARPQLSYDVRVPLAGCLTRRTSDANYENAVIVQESPVYLESSDRKYLLTCVPDTNPQQDTSFLLNFGGISVDSSLRDTEVVSGTGGTESLNYSVSVVRGVGPGGPSLNGAIDVGEDISYVVRIDDLRSNDVRIGRCWANDETSTIDLSSDEGCSLQLAGNVWSQFQVINSGPTRVYYNAIKAWAFPTSQRVNIFCNLHVCRSQCPQTDCADGRGGLTGNSVQKLRRDLPLEERGSTTIGATFDVMPKLQNTAMLSANEEHHRRRFNHDGGPRIITDPDVPNKYYGRQAASTDDHLAQPVNADDICINKMVFSIGLSLLILIALLCVLFAAMYFYRQGGVGWMMSSDKSTSSDDVTAPRHRTSPLRHHDVIYPMDSDRSTGSIITRASSQIIKGR